MNTQNIYLDYAAATPLDERVLAAMLPYFSEYFYNPSSPYEPARQVRRDVDRARAKIAAILGARNDEIIFTAGATESINIAFVANKGGHAVISNIEHHAVIEAAKTMDHTLVEADEKAFISPNAVKAAIRNDTTLVSIALGNNEVGTIQPLSAIAQVVKEIRMQRLMEGNTTPIWLHSDASQGAGLIDIHVARLGVDMLTLNAGKIYGPKQVGLLWAKAGVALSPLIQGGGQERGVRSGTENVAGIIGFAKALELAEGQRKQESYRLRNLRDTLQKEIIAAFDDVVVSGHAKHRLPHLLHMSWGGLDAERIIFALESQGVYVATGAACAASKQNCSHVLKAIGMSSTFANGSLRFSVGSGTSEQDIEDAAEIIIKTIQRELRRVNAN